MIVKNNNNSKNKILVDLSEKSNGLLSFSFFFHFGYERERKKEDVVVVEEATKYSPSRQTGRQLLQTQIQVKSFTAAAWTYRQ